MTAVSPLPPPARSISRRSCVRAPGLRMTSRLTRNIAAEGPKLPGELKLTDGRTPSPRLPVTPSSTRSSSTRPQAVSRSLFPAMPQYVTPLAASVTRRGVHASRTNG